MSLKCIAYDFDGTLGNTLEMSWDILNQLAKKHGFRPLLREDLARVREMTKSEFIKHLGISKFRLPMILNEARGMMHTRVAHIGLFDGVAEVIRAMRPKVCTQGIITSNTFENVNAVLAREGLEELIFTSSVSRLGKKHKHLRAVMRTFTYKPEDIIYVGDETRDVIAARKVGVRCVGVGWGLNSVKALKGAGATHTVETVQELKHYLETL